MNRIITSIVILLIPLSAICAPIKFRFASKAEGQQLMMEDTAYHNRKTPELLKNIIKTLKKAI